MNARHRILLSCVWLASTAWAQTSLVSGALDGSVSDSTGGCIPGVAVTARDTATNLTREVSTNSEGSYHFTELPVQSRNYLNFALLAPGVSSSAQQPGKWSLAALPDSGFTFGGLRGRSNNVSIDAPKGYYSN